MGNSSTRDSEDLTICGQSVTISESTDHDTDRSDTDDTESSEDKKEKTITFRHPDDDCSDGISRYVYIANPKADLRLMLDAEDLVTPEEFQIRFDYPLSNPVTFKFVDGPYTRRELAQLICSCYQTIYREEDESTKIPAGQISPNMLNRNMTDGKYGIWGHDIGDLVLHTVYIKTNEHGILYTLGIDS